MIAVAVAVIYYQNNYLLGYRHAHQHQGERYEFVGGKLEINETPIQALQREVLEEIGIDVTGQPTVKLGRIFHHYPEKSVGLHIYQIQATQAQYIKLSKQAYGKIDQPLCWVKKNELLAGQYPLPDANKTILQWLSLPTYIGISHPIDQVDTYLANLSAGNTANTASTTTTLSATDWQLFIEPWLDKHCNAILQMYKNLNDDKNLPIDQGVYVRLQTHVLPIEQQWQCVQALVDKIATENTHIASAITWIVPNDMMQTQDSPTVKALLKKHTFVVQVSHKQLMQLGELMDTIEPQDLSQQQLAKNNQYNDQHKQLKPILTDSRLPIICSCHDKDSIARANQLAQYLLDQQLGCVLGIFLSPVNKTASHPQATSLGWQVFSQLAADADMPVIALGGLSPKDGLECWQYGAVAVAGIRKFLPFNYG